MDHRKLRVDHRQPKFGSGVGTLLSDAHLTGRSGIVSTRQQRDNEVFADPTVD
jgi:hypothetical protein